MDHYSRVTTIRTIVKTLVKTIVLTAGNQEMDHYSQVTTIRTMANCGGDNQRYNSILMKLASGKIR